GIGLARRLAQGVGSPASPRRSRDPGGPAWRLRSFTRPGRASRLGRVQEAREGTEKKVTFVSACPGAGISPAKTGEEPRGVSGWGNRLHSLHAKHWARKGRRDQTVG